MRTYFIAAFILFSFSCSTPKKMNENPVSDPATTTSELPAFDKEGHRGCRGLMPENTIPAMLKALDLGVTTLELDVVITEDKKVVLSHEPFFNHEISTKPDGSYVTEAEEKTLKIYHMPYSEVAKYDVGMKPHPRFPQQQKMKAVKPLLSDVFDAVRKDMMTRRRPFPFYNIETKTSPSGDVLFHPKPEEFVDLLMAVIKEKGMEDFVIIQSFDPRTLVYLHKKYPNIKTAMLQEEFSITIGTDYLKQLGFTPTIYSPAYQKVTAEMIRSCHEKGMKIIPWTVNDKAKIEELKKMGVDGIITDFPNLFNE
ncbi:MAG TPA: glycerophosphodiester phosphodiesterase [Chitinophagaceae bacterium]